MTGISRRCALAMGIGSLGFLPRAAAASADAEIIAADFGQPVRIDDIAEGSWRQYELDGSPVFVRKLTAAQMWKRKPRSKDPWVVVSGLCTHAGCQVLAGLGAYRGFACFCHGSEYDEFGAVRRGPAKENLPEICHSITDGMLTFLSPEPCREPAK